MNLATKQTGSKENHRRTRASGDGNVEKSSSRSSKAEKIKPAITSVPKTKRSPELESTESNWEQSLLTATTVYKLMTKRKGRMSRKRAFCSKGQYSQ